MTDLGACSYLDYPTTVPPQPVAVRSLSENLKACETSGDFARLGDSNCRADRKAECEVLKVSSPAPKAYAAADAFAKARQRGTSHTADQTLITARVRPTTPLTPPRTSAQASPPAARRRTPEPSARRRTPEPSPNSRSESKSSSDPLDDALKDFLGERRVRRDSEDMSLVYGDVFDPEEAAKQANIRNHISRPVRAVQPEASFGWDDDDLDAPIDPEDIRRKYGSRAEGTPPKSLKKRPKKSED